MPDLLEKLTNETANEVEDLYAFQIREILSRRNGLPREYFGFCAQPTQTLEYFLGGIIGPGDEILTVGPTDEKIFEIITGHDASYSEYYEKMTLLPDPFEVVGRINKRTKLVLLGNPNRFTGTTYSEKEVEHILRFSDRSILLLDETTFDTGGVSAISLIKKYSNLALLRAFPTNGKESNQFIICNWTAFGETDRFLKNKIKPDSELPGILADLKTPEFSRSQIKKKKEEMLLLSTRLRMFNLECGLTPDYSIIIKSSEIDKTVSILSETGSRFFNLDCFPGMQGYIRLQLSPEIDIFSIVDAFKNKFYKEYNYRNHRHRLTIYRQSEYGETPTGNSHNPVTLEKVGE